MQVSITHVLHLGTTHCCNAATFVSMFSLLNYANYHVFCSSDELCSQSKAVLSNFVVIYKIAECGEEKTHLIKFDNHNDLSILSDQPGGDLYRFFLEQFNKQKTNYRSLRRDYENTDIVDTIISVCDYFLYLETNYPEYMIKQNMCHKMIPPDILYNMFSDANFLGQSQDDPKIQRLISVVTARFETFIKSEKMKVNLFTKRGLLDFVENGCLSDHCSFLRPFTRAEVKQILQLILQQVKENPHFKIYLLKDDYCIKNIEFIYLENKMFGLFESSAGYGHDYYECQIAEKPIIDLMDDFVKNELIKNHTFPESETISFLEQLITTC